MGSIAVSDWAECCAHCGWLEPTNMQEIENDESCTVRAVYEHLPNCEPVLNKVEHGMFMALWNARTHMKMNDVLLRRAEASLTDAMKPYISDMLDESSFFVNQEPDKFWER